MRIEYNKLFATPDELVDFLCKPNEEQDRIIFEKLEGGKKDNVELWCKIPGRSLGE